MIISSGITFAETDFGEKYSKWGNNLGLCMSVSCAVVVPIYMIVVVIKAIKSGESLIEVIYFIKKAYFVLTNDIYSYSSQMLSGDHQIKQYLMTDLLVLNRHLR